MPFNTDEIVRIDFRHTLLNQLCINTFWYKVAAVTTATASNVGSAWWDHIKPEWRSFAPLSANLIATQVFVTGMNVGSDLGAFNIPLAEQQGLRAIGASEFQASFVAATLNLTVTTRATRPGSKRVAGLLESDTNQNLLVSAVQSLLIALAGKYATSFIGSPGGVSFIPVIVKRKNPMVPPFTSQVITGSGIAAVVRSQVSRRLGKGR